jgi:hypothetical protein
LDPLILVIKLTKLQFEAKFFGVFPLGLFSKNSLPCFQDGHTVVLPFGTASHLLTGKLGEGNKFFSSQSVEPVLENAIKTLQKVVDVRGMGKK